MPKSKTLALHSLSTMKVFERGSWTLLLLVYPLIRTVSFQYISVPSRRFFDGGKFRTRSFSHSTASSLSAFNFQNPFQGLSGEAEDVAVDEFQETAAGLIRQARRLISSDFGILDATLLSDEDFIWVGPFLDQPLSKTEYLAAGRFFDLRAAFPDLDYRAHDFRIDASEERTVRLTCRVTGTMRGALRLRDGTLAPTGKTMKCPPEAVTIAFDPRGQVTKLCTGFVMDRQVGNTRGATGLLAAALVGGQPPSDWELYPAPAVIARFFGRPVPALNEVKAVLAPFPETVMISLAKGILASNMAADDPTLLADQFEYSTPYEGPVRKRTYLDKYAIQDFLNLNQDYTHFRVDPFNPFTVWVDVVPSGPGYNGAPQAMSFTFDDDGFCTRMTSGYVMDPSLGNGGGLGGREGFLYATDKASLPLLTRPWSRVVGRFRKKLLQPFTGVDVDDYKPVTKMQRRAAIPSRPAFKPPSNIESPSRPENEVADEPNGIMSTSAAKSQDTEREIRRQELTAQKEKAEQTKVELAQKRAVAAEEQKKQANLLKAKAAQNKLQKIEAKREAATKRLNEIEEKRKAAEAATAAKQSAVSAGSDRQMLADTIRGKVEDEKGEEQQLMSGFTWGIKDETKEKQALPSRKASPKPLPSKMQEVDVTRKKEAKGSTDELAQRAVAAQKAAAEAATAQRKRQREALAALSKAVSRATVSLFGLGGNAADEDDLPSPKLGTSTNRVPVGVPTMGRWRQNSDGSITGIVRGSRNFADGDKITTSPIMKGRIQSGEVVRTGSGSRYFLE